MTPYLTASIGSPTTWKHTTDNNAPGREIQAIFDEATGEMSADDKQALARLFCAKMVLAMPGRIRAENLPDSILAYYPGEFDRVAQRLLAFSQGQDEQGGNLLERLTRFLACSASRYRVAHKILISLSVFRSPAL